MQSYLYLVVGGGMTADAAVGGIREVDANASIGLIGTEAHLPYDRPPLTKGLWKGKPVEQIWRRAANQEAVSHLGRTAVRLDPQRHEVTDDAGEVYHYRKLLLATGGRPKRLPAAAGPVLFYRTLDDYYHLRMLSEQFPRLLVVGGGFIGSEIAAALSAHGNRVTMIVGGPGVGADLFPSELVQFLNDYYRQHDVELRVGEKVLELDWQEEEVVARTQTAGGQRRQASASAAVVGIGIEPNVALAEQAGLETNDGIRVDARLRTSHPDVYAAGDVASFYSSALERHVRVEHEDNANSMGQAAGRSMAGADVHYDYLPFFYSDLFDLGYEAVGLLDPSLQTYADWEEPYRKGVVYYLKEDRVQGVLLWNVWEQVEAARELIAAKGRFHPDDLKHRIMV